MMRLGFVAVALMFSTADAPAQPADAPPLRAILVRLAAYVQQFETDFALAVSDERYEQAHYANATTVVGRRTMDSEMLFVWLPHESLWLAARNPRVVDGKPVADSAGQIEQALDATDDERRTRLRRLRDESAKYNIGTIRRNFSDPTFALQFAAARLQPRFRWLLKARERVNGVDTFRIDFEEVARPALIRRDAVSLPSIGSIWVHAATNTIVRTRLYVSDRGARVRANVDVDYRFEPKLDVWVPARMLETYAQLRAVPTMTSAQMREESVRCVATYTNYRRFDTAVRVLP